MHAPRPTTLLPFLRWFPMSPATVWADLVAGITVALILVPQSMAYAQLAGLPVAYGLYASFIPVIVASLWGSLPQLHTGPVAMLSLMSAAAVLPLAPLGSTEFLQLSVMLALLVGILRLLLGLLRMGILVNFLSSPVIIGFTNAAALIIGLSQLSKVLNVPFPRTDNFIADLWTVVRQLGETHLPTLLFALATYLIIVTAQRVSSRIPGVLLAVVLTTLASAAIGFERNATVPVTAVQDARALQLIAEYRRTGREVADLSESTSAVAHELRALAGSHDERHFSERALLEADLRVLQRELKKRRQANNERRVALHDLHFTAVTDGDGAPRFWLRGEVPADLTSDGRTWRIQQVTGEQVLMMGGGAVVGTVPAGLPGLASPPVQLEYLWPLLPSALVMALIGFMEVTSISNAIATQTRARVDANRELIGQGLANIVGSFFSSFAVSGSFSRSAVAARTGARTGLFSLISAAAVVLVLLYLTPLLYHLPQATLAVIVMMAVFGLINVGAVQRAWRMQPQEALVGGLTFVATLVMAPQLANGILLGAGVGIVLFLARTMRPRIDLVGRHPDGRLGGVSANRLVPLGRRFLAVRFDGSLNFVTAAHFEAALLDARARNPQAAAVLVIASGINYIDVSGAERLRDVIENFHESGVAIYFSSLKSQVKEALQRARLDELLPPDRLFRTKEQAIAYLEARYDGATSVTA
ncbi:MAG: SulP family inorganic anion transporter [Chromatiaceae bacterium]|nr:MAG: SulP family inorganic anion transporter [Chromatiaceae bacterium]